MTIRRFAGAVSALLLTFGIGAIAPATGRAQSSVALPGEHSAVTVTGCFGYVKHQGYVLTNPSDRTTVPQPTCLISEGDPMIKLRDDVKKSGLTKTMLGRYVTVSGTMGDEYPNHPDRLRKLKVESAAIPAVVPPVVARRAEPIMPAPVPPQVVAPAPMPAPVEQPIGTTGKMRKHLPKTASSLPLVGFMGLMSLLAGLTLHVFGQRRLSRG